MPDRDDPDYYEEALAATFERRMLQRYYALEHMSSNDPDYDPEEFEALHQLLFPEP